MITVVGSLNMDLVISADKIPRPGETVLGKNLQQIPGGKGANQADAAARLGAEVILIGCVGEDDFGKRLLNSLKQDGVNIENILIKQTQSTGVASIIVEASGNNAITVAPGANYHLTSEDVEALRTVIAASDIVLSQLETPIDSVRTALKIARSSGKKTILNPAPAADLDDDILSLVDILTPNETELEYLSGHRTDSIENILLAGKILIARGVKELVITIGSMGCVHMKGEEATHYRAHQVNAVDTTAAGDSFSAALAVSLSNGRALADAIGFSMKVAAMTVTKKGAQTSLPHLEEVEAFDEWIKLQQIDSRGETE
ncbi:ribokinase [Anoxybacterium hadale]|uniref:Ribokinase n=1 Tax=Anoxybacterium hadale TaxID=3408580 RepID=A0ACD1A8M5_9FIRM|nr:ribokinase [Clostridiales bacterium]